MTSDSLPDGGMNNLKIFFESDEKWVALPEWFHFFLKLGFRLTKSSSLEKRSVVGLALPVRSYASSLTAAGIVIARAKINDSTSNDSKDEHFNKLCRLKNGTPLIYRKCNKELKGKFAGVTTYNKETRIRVQITSRAGGSLTYLINKEMSKAVIIFHDKVKLPKKQTGRVIIRRKGFLDIVFSNANIYDFVYFSRLECAIVGPVNVFRREITETHISVKNKDNFVEGTLQDILRVKRFLPENRAFRTEVIPATGKNPKNIQGEIDPFIVIYDGANGYLKWRNNWPSSNNVIILDRTEPNFDEAANILNQDFIKKRIDNGMLLDIPTVPPGIEMIVYEERCR